MFTNLIFRGFDYYADWRQRLPRQPHVVSVCTVPPLEEPLTLDEAKLRCNFTWPSPDDRDALIESFVRTARAKVEFDTGLALLEQTRAVSFDTLMGNIIVLPEHSQPLVAVDSIAMTLRDGSIRTIDPGDYVVDYAGARIALLTHPYWTCRLRSFAPWLITIRAGWTDPETLEAFAPILRHLVGLLVAHFGTLGRDLATIERGTLDEIPQGYSDLLAPYLPVAVI